MSESKHPRPAQVTLAGWLVVGGSVVVVVTAFGEVAALRSLETREAVAEWVGKAGGDVFGMGVQGVLSLMRVLLMVVAASATATAILGWQALQRSRGARVALSLLAVPLFVAGLVQQGGLASAVVTAAIVMLWFQPARDWFDGINRPPPARPDPTAHRSADQGTGQGTAHRAPSADRDPVLDRLPPPTAPPLHPTPYAAEPTTRGPQTRRPAAAATPRPRAVTWACVLTWAFSTAAFVLFAYSLAAMLAAPTQLLDELHRQNPQLAEQGLTDATIRAIVYATSAVVLPWTAASAALAILAWRRISWAATALMVSAGLAGALCLVGVVGSVLLVVPVAACAAILALLVRPESRAWFRPLPPGRGGK